MKSFGDQTYVQCRASSILVDRAVCLPWQERGDDGEVIDKVAYFFDLSFAKHWVEKQKPQERRTALLAALLAAYPEAAQVPARCPSVVLDKISKDTSLRVRAGWAKFVNASEIEKAPVDPKRKVMGRAVFMASGKVVRKTPDQHKKLELGDIGVYSLATYTVGKVAFQYDNGPGVLNANAIKFAKELGGESVPEFGGNVYVTGSMPKNIRDSYIPLPLKKKKKKEEEEEEKNEETSA